MTKKCMVCRQKIDARTLRAGGELCWECSTGDNMAPTQLTEAEHSALEQLDRVQNALQRHGYYDEALALQDATEAVERAMRAAKLVKAAERKALQTGETLKAY